jgi:phosphate transport system permease protein
MIVPTVISLSIDAINYVPQSYIEAGFAFGMTHFRVIWKIMLPCARSGIIAGLILAAGRGIGEAIAVSMVCGGVAVVPDFTRGFVAFLAPVLPLSAAIVNKSEAMGPKAVDSALFACAAMLLFMGAFLSFGAKLIERQMRKAVGYVK